MLGENQSETIFIAEDDQTAFTALRELFTAQGWQVMRFNTRSLLKNQDTTKPGLVILGNASSVAHLRKLRQTSCQLPVIFIHSNASISGAVQAIQAGADNYLARPYCPDTLLTVVRQALDKAWARWELDQARRENLARLQTLTERERAIIRFTLDGLLNKQIADKLGVALITVKVHRGKAMRKLGAKTAGELARLAHELVDNTAPQFDPPVSNAANHAPGRTITPSAPTESLSA